MIIRVRLDQKSQKTDLAKFSCIWISETKISDTDHFYDFCMRVSYEIVSMRQMHIRGAELKETWKELCKRENGRIFCCQKKIDERDKKCVGRTQGCWMDVEEELE